MIVYLDLGCGDGGDVEWLTKAGNIFKDPHYYHLDKIFAFDPIRSAGWDLDDTITEFYECAAWVKSGHAHLSMNADPNLRTIIPKNVNFEKEPDGAGVVKQLVKTIDFPYWMQQNLKFEDTIICKISIEGAEYELLESLCKTKDKQRVPLIAWFNHLFVEFNGHKMKEEFQPAFAELEKWIRSHCPIEIQPWSPMK